MCLFEQYVPHNNFMSALLQFRNTLYRCSNNISSAHDLWKCTCAQVVVVIHVVVYLVLRHTTTDIPTRFAVCIFTVSPVVGVVVPMFVQSYTMAG